jgi:hypothetical protein
MTRNGEAFELPTWVPAIPASGSSSSPDVFLGTPTSRMGKGAGPVGGATHQRNRERGLIEAQVLDLPLLKTPTSQLAVNGGSQHPDKRKAGGHGPTLADEVEHLLPSPRASDGAKGGPNQRGSKGDLALPSTVVRLLPTPQAHDAQTPKTPEQVAAGRTKGHGVSNLNETVVNDLLPTPQANLGSHGRDNGQRPARRRELGRQVSLADIACHLPEELTGANTVPPSPAGKTSPDAPPPTPLNPTPGAGNASAPTSPNG